MSIEAAPAKASSSRHDYEVTAADLPVHCPTDDSSLWNMHPRVYLPVEASGEALCPYCGARFVLKGGKAGH